MKFGSDDVLAFRMLRARSRTSELADSDNREACGAAR
jgi:hypothetical protein